MAPNSRHPGRRQSRALPADLDLLCLTAMHHDPSHRYQAVDRLIRDVDHFLNAERLEARPDTLWYSLRSYAVRRRVPLAFAAAVLLGAALSSWALLKLAAVPAAPIAASEQQTWRTVAVLPFQNAGTDRSLDFLRLGLPDEVATILSHIRSVSVRPFATTSRYGEPSVDPQQAGREMRAGTVVTGHFLRAGEALQDHARGNRRRGQSVVVARHLRRAGRQPDRNPGADRAARAGRPCCCARVAALDSGGGAD